MRVREGRAQASEDRATRTKSGRGGDPGVLPGTWRRVSGRWTGARRLWVAGVTAEAINCGRDHSFGHAARLRPPKPSSRSRKREIKTACTSRFHVPLVSIVTPSDALGPFLTRWKCLKQFLL